MAYTSVQLSHYTALNISCQSALLPADQQHTVEPACQPVTAEDTM